MFRFRGYQQQKQQPYNIRRCNISFDNEEE